jgi:predicted TIM-barrel fold metal-dependent hydrolase
MDASCGGGDGRTDMTGIEGATDTHFHVFGPPERYPYVAHRTYTPPDALPSAAVALFRRLGIARAVLIQASSYGFDNSRHLDAAAELGIPARVVVVVPLDTPEPELARMHERGARGVRFILTHPGGLVPADLARFSHRLAAMGWHVDLMASPGQLVEHEHLLRGLACPIVIDHLGMVRADRAADRAAAAVVERLLLAGHCWVKISGAYRVSNRVPEHDDVGPWVRRLVETRPDRLFWGSDWPHVSIDVPTPDTGTLFAAFRRWVPEAEIRERILVANPAAFYGF